MYIQSDKQYRENYNDFRKGSPYNVSCLSNGYYQLYVQEDDYRSKEDTDVPNKKLLKCPICFKFIWDKPISCHNCKKDVCRMCFDTMLVNSYASNNDLKCPFCRILVREVDSESFLNVTINEEEEHIRRREYSGLDNFLTGVLLVLLTIIFIIFIFIL